MNKIAVLTFVVGLVLIVLGLVCVQRMGIRYHAADKKHYKKCGIGFLVSGALLIIISAIIWKNDA
jgi:hypothetical protein